MKKVIAALYPRALATSLALPMDVLQGASQAAAARKLGDGALSFEFAALTREPLETVGGLPITPSLLLQEIDHCDMLLLPAMWRNPQPVLRQQSAWLPILRRLHEKDTLICSVGTGSCSPRPRSLWRAFSKGATVIWDTLSGGSG